jgi:hypothetical protein
MITLEEIYRDKPRIHFKETELPLQTDFLDLHCYGIPLLTAQFIHETLQSDWVTLEIGCGITTLIFMLKGCHHTCITPYQHEAQGILEYARRRNIKVEDMNFIIGESQEVLPTALFSPLDFVFIDGKHAFPWPVIDFYYAARWLKPGGIIGMDDSDMESVNIVCRFMDSDPHWLFVKSCGTSAQFFRNINNDFNKAVWNEQPFITNSYQKSPITPGRVFRWGFKKTLGIFQRKSGRIQT